MSHDPNSSPPAPQSGSNEAGDADISHRMLAPVDLASLVLFRIGFGLIAAWWALDYMFRGRMFTAYIQPQFHFTYFGLDWIQPLPGGGMYLLFISLAISGLCICAGLLYRLATIVFALGLTYVFLLDRTNYQNHYYLLVLISWVMVLLPLHQSFSLDAVEGRVKKSSTVPAWMLWFMRFHIALPYFFGGIAKFEADWFAGAPLRQTLESHSDWPILGPWFHSEWVVQCFIWGGLLFDLCVVPLLLWRPTRLPAYLVAVLFHVLNSQLFSIHIFPWFMLVATTLFFDPNWPLRIFHRKVVRQPPSLVVPNRWRELPRKTKLIGSLLCAYCLFHTLWPLRHHLYPGPASWTEQGHFFSWRMMLRGKTVGIRYYLTDPETGQTQIPDLRPLLSPIQLGVFARDPEMILHLAHHIAAEYRKQFGKSVEVRALVMTSLNGRKPQLQIDPNVDLAKIPRGFHPRPWILPQSEPLPAQPCNLPISEWERSITLPDLEFLNSATTASQAQ